MANVRRKTVPVPPPAAKLPEVATQPEAAPLQPASLADVLAKIGHQIESAWTNAGGSASALQNIVSLLGGLVGHTPQVHAKVAERQQQNAAADTMGWSTGESKPEPAAKPGAAAKTDAGTKTADAAAAQPAPPAKPASTPSLLSETRRRVADAVKDRTAEKAEVGAIVYSIGQDLRRAQAAGTPMSEFQAEVFKELITFRTASSMAFDLAQVNDNVMKRLAWLMLSRKGPEAYEALGLELLGGQPPEPLPERVAGAGTEAWPYTDTLISSFSVDLNADERTWLRNLAGELATEGQTLERMGPTPYPALLAEKVAEHLATGVAVSPGFSELFAKLTREGHRPELEKKLAGKIKVDPSLAPPPPPSRDGQRPEWGDGAYDATRQYYAPSTESPAEPQRGGGRVNPNDGQAGQAQNEQRLKKRRISDAQEDEANRPRRRGGGGGGGDSNENQVRLDQGRQQLTQNDTNLRILEEQQEQRLLDLQNQQNQQNQQIIDDDLERRRR